MWVYPCLLVVAPFSLLKTSKFRSSLYIAAFFRDPFTLPGDDPPVISWFIIPSTVDILYLHVHKSQSEIRVMWPPTKLSAGGTIVEVDVITL